MADLPLIMGTSTGGRISIAHFKKKEIPYSAAQSWALFFRIPNCFPDRTVAENLYFVLRAHRPGRTKIKMKNRMIEGLMGVGLVRSCHQKMPTAFRVENEQRVVFVRALLNEPFHSTGR